MKQTLQMDLEVKAMSLIKVDPTKAAKLQAEKRIAELKDLLSASDFKVLPDYDQPSDEIKTQRQAWRQEIRQLEGS